jgi:hypothetical protein
MFGQAPQNGSLTSVLAPLVIIAVVLVLRNARPRRLRVETLWVLPLIYLLGMAGALAAAPPPLTPLSIGILAVAAAIGAVIGWQRARFMRLDLDPQTHQLTSRASPLGVVFILAIFALRYGGRSLLAGEASSLHLPIVAITYAFLVLAVVMIATQRIEIWRRATQMLAEARGERPPAPPPDSIVR